MLVLFRACCRCCGCGCCGSCCCYCRLLFAVGGWLLAVAAAVFDVAVLGDDAVLVVSGFVLPGG